MTENHSLSSKYHLTLAEQHPGCDGKPVYVPAGGHTTPWVDFVSCGQHDPAADDLVLVVKKHRAGVASGPVDDPHGSVFCPTAGWIDSHRVSRATIHRYENHKPVYRFAVPLAHSEPAAPMADGRICEEERSYCEDFAVVIDSNGKHLADQQGTPAFVSIPLYVRTNQPPRADLLILAPHPDDEVLSCSGVIMQAVSRGKVPLIVVVNNGGMTRKTREENIAFAYQRQSETLHAVARLGVAARQVLFLGYAEGGIVVPSRHTGKTMTTGDLYGQYGGKLDYHSIRFGVAAPCSKQAFISDLKQILQDYAPSDVYLPVSSDTHTDHRVACQGLETALDELGVSPARHYWILHTREGDGNWPPPRCLTTCHPTGDGGNPAERFTPDKKMPPPPGYPPFDEHVPVAPHKRDIIFDAYRTQAAYGSYAQGYLLACVKQTEGFWKRNIPTHERYIRRWAHAGRVALPLVLVLTLIWYLTTRYYSLRNPGHQRSAANHV